MSGHHPPLQPISENERQIFDYLLRPDDLYDQNGTYWADLPLTKRIKFVNSYDNKEAAREFKGFLRMVKNDPLSPFPWYFKNMVLPGAGLGLEGYVLFSIGNVTSIFTAKGTFEDCWKTYAVCDESWVAAVVYMEILGIMVGQVLVGVLGMFAIRARDMRGSTLTETQATGLGAAGVSFKMRSSCFSACSC